jgi:hypothetical protein
MMDIHIAMKKATIILLVLFSFCSQTWAQVFDIVSPQNKVSIYYDTESKLDSIAANLLATDIELVSGYRPSTSADLTRASGNVIVIGNINSKIISQFRNKLNLESLRGKWECYGYRLFKAPTKKIKNALFISGSDFRGTAYGVFDLSARLGVSPWYWWADVRPAKRNTIAISIKDYTSAPPAVKYRGIFINDEDWGLQPWAAKTFEPETGDIGPKTYAKVFELLLRLKANLIWPAMHPSTKAFFHYPGNVTTAEDYQIIVGSSHAEPMLRNNVGEWDVKTMGHFNYFTNKERIYKYWEDRVKESKDVNAIYTLGMRGVHDGQMEGIKDLKEAVPVVEGIIQEERGLLAKYINKDVTTIPQVLTPYKEVLDIYDHGLKVPEDVTLVWPDDNYGYIHRLNNEQERKRKGGAGVYYHASYWGRPHDYLWLPSTHPALITEEMMKAYETGASRLWVLNVGDIKPQEYNLQQFLDMAYNPAPFKDPKYTQQHLLQWTTAIFGKEKGQKIQSILWEYYRLAFERRPEFMGWSQTEPNTKTTYTDFNHFYFGDEAQKRIDSYNTLEKEVKRLRSQMNTKEADAFYQLVYYPVVGASWINKKFLYRDKGYFYAKQNRLSAYEYAQRSRAAYDSIVRETEYYNTQLAGGKWKHMMSMNPRNLAVYQEPVLPAMSIDSTNAWSIAPEGYVTKDSSLVGADSSLSLPAFDVFNKQQYFIDLFLTKNQTIKWSATVSHNWIRLSKGSGQLTPDFGNKQERIWVDIDWNKMKTNVTVAGNILFTADGRQMVVNVQVTKRNKHELAGYNGFIEDNGFITMYATHFTRQTKDALHQWKRIDGLGYTGNALQALPLTISSEMSTNPDSIITRHSFVAYDFYTFSSVNPFVTIFTLPTHPINNNFSVRYAVSIDNGPLKVVDVKTFGRSEEWKQNVLRNRTERRIEMPFLKAGKHTLKIYCVDPGVILDEIRIDLGGLKKAYTTIPETRMNSTAQSAF